MAVHNRSNITAGIPQNIYMSHDHVKLLVIVDKISMYIQGLCIIFSLISNTLVVLASARSTVLSISKFLIRYLAISDLFYSIFQFFLFHRRFKKHIWSFGQILCKLSVISPCAIMTSLFTIVFIAYERQRSILYPFKNKLSKYQASIAVTLSWVISVAVHIPIFLNKKLVKVNEQTDCADVPNDLVKYWDLVLFTISYPISFACLLIFYIRVVMKVTRNKENCNLKLSEEQSSRSKTKHRKLICMLVAIVLTFFITTTPNHIFILWLNFGEKNMHMSVVTFITLYGLSTLVHLHSFVNPVIYCIINPNFISYKKKQKLPPRSRAYTDSQLLLRHIPTERLSQPALYIDRSFIEGSFIVRGHRANETQYEQFQMKEVAVGGTEISRKIEDSCLLNTDVESILVDANETDAEGFEQPQESINKHFETDCNASTNLMVEKTSYFYRKRANTCGRTLSNNEDRNENRSTETKDEIYDHTKLTECVSSDGALEEDSLFVSRGRSHSCKTFKEFCENIKGEQKVPIHKSYEKMPTEHARKVPIHKSYEKMPTEHARNNPKHNFTQKSFNKKHKSTIWHKLEI